MAAVEGEVAGRTRAAADARSIASASDEADKVVDEIGPGAAKLLDGVGGEPPEHRLSSRAELQAHTAAIGLLPASHHVPRGESVHQLHGAVMSELQPLGQGTDRRRRPPFQPLDLQKRQVLLGGDSRRPRRRLSEAKETPDLVPKIGQRPVVRPASPRLRHSYP